MAYVVALDQGTTSSRAIVFDQEGSIAAIAQQEFEQHFPKPGWVEHDPQDIWSSQIGVVDEALRQASIGAADLAAIGITNQRETTVVWDRQTGEPVHRAIVWQDRRTAPVIDRLSAGHKVMIREKTGLIPDAYFSATKVAWILDNVGGARERAIAGDLACGTIDAWLVHKLTGGRLHLTDVSNASRTMLFNIREGVWDDELLELFGVPRSLLPEVRASSEAYGEASAAPLTSVPIAGIAGDQQAALAGQTCFEPGMGKNTYGTGCFMLMNTGAEAVASQNNLLTTIAWKIGEELQYALEGSVFIGGAVVQWLRDGLRIIDSAPQIETLALSVEDNGGVYFVPAFAGLGAPHWDQYARGTICGITRGTTRAHIARAALESIAYQVADLLEAMASDAHVEHAELRVDGGAAGNDTLLQFQSDILQTPIVRPRVTETTALGAAYLAGLGVGYWKDVTELSRQWQVERRFEPAMSADRVAALRERWKEAVGRAARWELQEAQ